MKDVLIIKTNALLPKDVLWKLRESFLEQVQSGVVVIPPYFEAELIHVPENVEVIVESTPTAEFLEKDFNLAK